MAARLGLPDGGLDGLVFESTAGQAAQRGEMTDADLWQWLGQHLGLTNHDLRVLYRDFWAGDVLDHGLIDMVASLRHRYHTAIISNATDHLMHTLQVTYPTVAPAFDLIVCSASEGLMKPEAEIYYRTLQRLNCPPAAAVFVDDNQDNVRAAHTIGLKAIHFQPTVDLPAVFAQLGVV